MPSFISTPLTPEQRKLAEENHGLIYDYVFQRNLELNDWYDELAIALCQAARSYNPSRGSFSTWAFYHFRGVSGHRFAKDARRKNLIFVQSFAEIVDTDSGERSPVDDMIGFLDPNFERIEWEMMRDQLLSRLSARDQIIYKMRRQGCSTKEIAAKIGITHQAVCARLKHIERKAAQM
jgi:RNA polymerase sigma factor (sigma-70 family)